VNLYSSDRSSKRNSKASLKVIRVLVRESLIRIVIGQRSRDRGTQAC
jgi:hypothetical protein